MARSLARLTVLAALVAATPALAQGAHTGFPAAMRGTWGYEARSCTEETDEGHINVAVRTVDFFASACTLTRFARRGDGTWTGRGRCTEEGENTHSSGSVSLRLVAPDRLAVAREGNAPHVYQRCSRARPVR